MSLNRPSAWLPIFLTLSFLVTACSDESPQPASEPSTDSSSVEETENPTQPAKTDSGLTCLSGDWDGDGKDEGGSVERSDGTLMWTLPGTKLEKKALAFGLQSDTPIVGDWNGDGKDTPGVFRDGGFHLLLDLEQTDAVTAFAFGLGTDIPVAGDWNGDGTDTIGVFRDGAWFLIDVSNSRDPDHTLGFGEKGDLPVVGDWNGDGIDSLGVNRDGFIYLSYELGSPVGDVEMRVADPGEPILAGDWDQDGADTLGIVKGPGLMAWSSLEEGSPSSLLSCR